MTTRLPLEVSTKAEVRFVVAEAHWLPKEVGLLTTDCFPAHVRAGQVAERLLAAEAGRVNKHGVSKACVLIQCQCHL